MIRLVSLGLVSCATSVRASILGAAVIPHGDFAFDPSLVHYANGSAQLHNASIHAGYFVSALQPDIIFLTTPHGLELDSDFLIYENLMEVGDAPVGSDLGPHHSTYDVAMNVTTNTTVARQLTDTLRSHGYNVSGLQGFSDSRPLPISWGEILPLSFVNRSMSSLGRKMPRVVMMGIPLRRFKHSAAMVPELLSLGGAIAKYFNSQNERVAWVVSSDLAHTHLASGPYGYCPCAQPFDDAVARWLQTLNSSAIVKDAAMYQRQGAESCGFTGIVLLQGAIEASGGMAGWQSELWAIAAPTYYGMAVAGLTPGKAKPSQLMASLAFEKEPKWQEKPPLQLIAPLAFEEEDTERSKETFI